MKRQHINTDNYEEYFLLYVDNELTAEERASVEEFILQHPGLKDELNMFMDTRLDMEELHFDGKDMLLKSETQTINEENIEELQVLLIDGELDPARAAEVEAYSASHTRHSNNLEWLKKAKLPEERIVFPDKSTLYRTEKKPAAIISIRWYRVAAAAAVILVAGLLWMNRTVEPVGTPIAVTGDKNNNNNVIPGTDSADRQIQAPAAPYKEEQLADRSLEASQSQEGKNTEQHKAEKTIHQPVVTYASVDRTIIDETVAKQTEIKVTEQAEQRLPSRTMTEKTEEVQATQAVAMNVKTDYVSEALYTDNGNVQDELPMEDHKDRKGLRGLVRKANRFYNKVTNPDPDKAMVKVASFEIGLPR